MDSIVKRVGLNRLEDVSGKENQENCLSGVQIRRTCCFHLDLQKMLERRCTE